MILAVCPNPSVDTYLYMDAFHLKKSSRVTNKERYAGGKGIHIALAAAELGEEVTLLCFWGGETGKWLKQQCEEHHIRCIGPHLSDDNRSCYTIKTPEENDDTEILEKGPEITDDDYQEFMDVFKQNISQAHIVSMSGSWPPGAPDAAYAEMINICHQEETPHILDATGIKMQIALQQNPYGIHINMQEAMELYGSNEPKKVLNSIPENIHLVALTAGKEGLYLRMNKKIIHSNIVLPQIHSAVGSGDCLTAGLSIALKHNFPIEETARLSTACGAANCLRKELGMLYRKDVEKLKNEIEILNFIDE